jgi:hypothetical protein
VRAVSLSHSPLVNAVRRCGFRREYAVSGHNDAEGKWADFAIGIPDLHHPQCLIVMDDIGLVGSGGMRKLTSMSTHVEASLALQPDAIVRAIAVSGAEGAETPLL